MITPFRAETLQPDIALLTLVLGLGTFMFARNFKGFARAPYGNKTLGFDFRF